MIRLLQGLQEGGRLLAGAGLATAAAVARELRRWPLVARSAGSDGAVRLLIALLICVGVGCFVGRASATKSRLASDGLNDYRLGAQDKVRVRVFEWRPSRDEIFGWQALNAEYKIGANGKVSFPLLGEISAEGLTEAELAKLIGEQLRDRMGLAMSPDTSVEIAEYRPFYVVGEVEKPGEYPYRPGLTVLKAITLGGGISKGREFAGLRLEREAIATKGELRLMSQDYKMLLARKSRLEAELRGSTVIAPAAGLGDDPKMKEYMDQEVSMFEARNDAHQTQVSALEQLRAYLGREVDSLELQIQNHENEIGLVRKEFESVKTLTAKGLATSPRKLAMERSISQMDSERLRLSTSLMKVKQDISRTALSILELRNKRITDINAELQQTRAKLHELEQKSKTASLLLDETETIAPRLLVDEGQSALTQPVLKIVRTDDDSSFEFVAAETTQVRPGDTVKVELVRGQRKPGRAASQ